MEDKVEELKSQIHMKEKEFEQMSKSKSPSPPKPVEKSQHSAKEDSKSHKSLGSKLSERSKKSVS